MQSSNFDNALKLLIGIVFLTVAIGMAMFSVTARADFEIDNKGISLAGLAEIGDLGVAAFTVYERNEGNADLNGDGDALDHVLHVYDLATDKIVNYELAIHNSTMDIYGDFIVFEVWEARQGYTDFNDDGDTADFVTFYINALSGEIINTGIAGQHIDIGANGQLLMTISESGQAFTDFNGDGDTDDGVAFLYDMSSGVLTNLGLSANGSSVKGDIVAINVYEPSQGNTDLNGDGDLRDSILHLYNTQTGVTQNLGISGFPRSGGNVTFYWAKEVSDGMDYNNDGDLLDLVFHVYDPDTDSSTNFELAAGGYDPELLVEDLVGFNVSESGQGNIDLNGDGDFKDTVLHIYNHSSRQVHNVGVGSGRTYLLKSDGRFVAFIAEETQEGFYGTDLNGDGDSSDSVLQLFDAATNTVTNLGAAIWSNQFQIVDGVLFYGYSEFYNGRIDLNGDGDIADRILHSYNPATGVTVNFGLSAFPQIIQSNLLIYGLSEYYTPYDYNEDGDSFDWVFHMLDLNTQETTNFGIASQGIYAIGPKFVLMINEETEGATDFNSDGDAMDLILGIVDPYAEPASTIADLIEEVLGAQLANGTGNALLVKLDAAQAAFEKGNVTAGNNSLAAFINQLSALAGKKLTTEQADEWTEIALKLIANSEPEA